MLPNSFAMRLLLLEILYNGLSLEKNAFRRPFRRNFDAMGSIELVSDCLNNFFFIDP